MIKYHIDNALTKIVKESTRFNDLTDEEHERLYSEVRNVTLQGIDNKLVDECNSNVKRDNNFQSLLLWVIGITDEKPLSSQVIKSEGSYADVDSDIMKNNREDLIKYIKEKYGSNRVCQIATFGTMGAKGSIRNSARALGYSIELGNKVAKFIPEAPGITIQESIDSNKDFADLILKDKEVKHIIDVARKLEGLPNSVGTHASGLIIADKDLNEYYPLMSASRKDSDCIISQFEYKDAEANFTLKFDLLGLQTLDIIKEAIDLINRRHSLNLNMYSIDVNDPNIYKLINEGFLTLIFQLDGSMSAYIPRWKPQNIQEVSDLNATARPGPLEMGLVEKYIEAKFENKKYDYGLKDRKLIEKLWEICDKSYGLMLYQEQLISCFTELADFSEIEADLARRATGKKKPEEMKALGEKFIPRAVAKGYKEEDVKNLFEQFQSFSAYSFNLSHSLCYSYIAAYTAWLSYYYPLEFFTAAMTVQCNNTGDIRSYIKAIKNREYKILPPDINKSDAQFIIEDESIIFGLNAIKGVGASMSKKIMTRRPKSGYKSLGHFVNRNRDLVNSKILEFYTKAGCFSSFMNKESILGSIQHILDWNLILKEVDTYTIFDLCKVDNADYIDNCIVKRSNKEDDISNEIQSIGLYITKHPMEDYILDKDRCIDISDIKNYSDGDPIITVGALSGIEVKKTKAKLNMATFNIDSDISSVECIMFPKAYSKNYEDLEEGQVVVLVGKCKEENEKISLIVDCISTDLSKHAYKVTKKKDKVYYVDELTDLVDFIEDYVKVKINNNQIFVLRKNK